MEDFEKLETYFLNRRPTKEDVEKFKNHEGVVLIHWLGHHVHYGEVKGELYIRNGKYIHLIIKACEQFKLEPIDTQEVTEA